MTRLKDKEYELKDLHILLRKWNKEGKINTFSVQNKDINSNYKYTYVSFKVPSLNSFNLK